MNVAVTRYMSPSELIRLDVAIEIQQNTLGLYERHVKLGKRVTFKDIIKKYVRLDDFEHDSNKYKDLIN